MFSLPKLVVPRLAKFPPTNLPRRQVSYFGKHFSRQYWLEERPPPAKFQVKLSPQEKGHFHYERYWSRDSRYKPQFSIDNPTAYFHRFSEDYEARMVWAIIGYCSIGGILFGIYTMFKIEVWADRKGQNSPSYDWWRVRDKYWKYPTYLLERTGLTHQRLGTMEKLEDEMLEAAKKRGTRNEHGDWKSRN